MKIEHVALWVRDLEAARQFYETYFEAQAGGAYHNVRNQFTSYFLSFPDGARLELMQMDSILADGREIEQQYFGWAHIAFAVGSEAAVDALTERLIAAGLRHLDGPRWTGDGYYESTFLDPEGNRLEITV